MNIVVIVPDFSVSHAARTGGGTVSGLLLIRQLLSAGHSVSVVAYGRSVGNRSLTLPEGLLDVHFVKKGLGFPRNPYSGFYSLLRALKKLESAAHVVHCYSLGNLPALMLCKRFGLTTPVVATLNGYSLVSPDYSAMLNGKVLYRDTPYSVFSSFLNLANALKPRTVSRIIAVAVAPIATVLFPLLVTKAGLGAAHYIAIGKDVCDLHRARGYRPITIIPNMVDDSFENVTKSRHKIIAYVGRLIESKGVETLIRVFVDSDCATRFGYSLWIVGDGPLHSRLTARFAARAGIRFWGHVNQTDLPNVYKDIDIFVHPGIRPEAFGRTVIEAVQTECRILVSDIGEPKHIVSPYGLKYRFNDPRDLQQQLEKMINQPEVGLVPKSVLQRYKPRSITERIVAIYHAVRQPS